MISFPGKKLLFQGGDFGQWDEWSHDKSIDWHLLQYPLHQGLQRWMSDLLRLYRGERALHEIDFQYEGFEWIDFQDSASSVIVFERVASDRPNRIVVACNFTPVPRVSYRIGVTAAGTYSELLNSDSSLYGGSNTGNAGSILAEPIPMHGRMQSLSLTLPPLGVLLLKLE